MFNKYPYTNFHELNLEYFIKHFEEIFTQWESLYNELQAWKTGTTEELEAWKTEVENGIADEQARVLAELEAWKTETGEDIDDWEASVLTALNSWKEDFETLFATTFANLTQIKTDAETARDAAQAAQAAAEDAAVSVSASAAQIAENASDIVELKNSFDNTSNYLNSIFTEFNIFEKFPDAVTRYTHKTWIRGDDLVMTDSNNFDIVKIAISDDVKYYVARPFSGASAGNVRFSTSDNIYNGLASSVNDIITIPADSAFVYVLVNTGENGVIIPEEYYMKYSSGYKREINETYNTDAVYAKETANANKSTLSAIVKPSLNLADRSKFTEGHYMTGTGATGANASYFYTEKIPVSEGDIIYTGSGLAPSAPRYTCAFNGNSVVSITFSNPYTVPSGITHLVFTGYTNAIDKFTVSKNAFIPYVPYRDYINQNYLEIDNMNALNGNSGISIESATLEADTTLNLSNYPYAINTHDRMSGVCKFSAFDEILFGYGYTSGAYFAVDDTNIISYKNGVAVATVPHGLTISDYLAFSVIMANDRIANVVINSMGGSFSTTLGMNTGKVGMPFIRSTTALSNIKISAICADIRKPIWWFGDSYSSNANERVIGQLNNYGIIENMLIDAFPGYRSYFDENRGGYPDLMKLIVIAKPKFIIWALGMNDSNANYQSYLTRIKNVCDAFGIELYAVKIPSVPGIDNSTKNAYIDTLGLKTIDWNDAVGATSAGVWYTGYLSDDNVHPTVLGAKALAARTLADCPAIMQF